MVCCMHTPHKRHSQPPPITNTTLATLLQNLPKHTDLYTKTSLIQSHLSSTYPNHTYTCLYPHVSISTNEITGLGIQQTPPITTKVHNTNHTNITAAELTATLSALHLISSLSSTNFLTLTDSLIAIQQLQNMYSKTRPGLIHDIVLHIH